MAYTLEEIAKLAGVSRSTVSRVVNNQASVRPEVRERVLHVIQTHHYQPHQATRTLVTRRTQAIGLIIPEVVKRLFTDVFYQVLIQGIAEVCNQRDYYLTLILATAGADRARLYRRALNSGQLDGVVVVAVPVGDPIMQMIRDSQLRCVQVGRHPDLQDTPYVDIDNQLGARRLTEYLIGLGHRRIAQISGPLWSFGGLRRLQGYREALAAARIPAEPALVAEGDYTEDSGMAAMERLLPQKPTAVFAANDTMAAGALRTLARAGLSVPDQVSVVGFDDAPFAGRTEPPLTTMSQPILQMGRLAAQKLLGWLDNPDTPVSSELVSMNLIIRQSARPPQSALAAYRVA